MNDGRMNGGGREARDIRYVGTSDPPPYFRRKKTESGRYLILIDAPRFRREVHAYLKQLARVGSKGCGIPLVFYLLQGFVRRLVELALDDVDVVLGLHHDVDATP